jgi:hypothetical protein
MVIPRQPGCRVTKDRRAVLLQRPQILQRVAPGVEAGGNETGEDTGDVCTMLRGVKQTVFPLPNDELQEPFGHIIVQSAPGVVKKVYRL